MENEMTVMEEFNLAPIEDGTDIALAIQEEIGTLGTLELARAAIPTGGMTMFALKQGADDEPEMVKYIEGVIILHHAANAYWVNPFSGAGTQPDCASMDGIEGMVARTGEITLCADCPYNRFGSELRQDGAPGKGKACKNAHRLYVLRDGEYLPVLINLPPTALRPFKKYLQSIIVPKVGQPVRRSYGVVTRIGLKTAKSDDGITYSVPTFTMVGDIPAGKINALREYAETFKISAQRVMDDTAITFE